MNQPIDLANQVKNMTFLYLSQIFTPNKKDFKVFALTVGACVLTALFSPALYTWLSLSIFALLTFGWWFYLAMHEDLYKNKPI
jgi:hypothetical protein